MLLILVDQITNRMDYTFDFIFKERKMSFKLITSVYDFESAQESHKLNYSSHTVQGVKRIPPSLLLRESTLVKIEIDKGRFEGIDCLSFDGEVDVVSSVFYVLSRFEEYQRNVRDEHGRFPYSASILSKFNWIEQAVCDRWAKSIIEFIDADLYIDVTLSSSLLGSNTKLVPTFDIDNTYAYKYKTGKRKILSVCKDILKFNTGRIKERNDVSAGSKDPYDTFDQIESIAKEFPETKLFWLVESDGVKDRNLSIDVPEHAELIKQFSEIATVGLHPSYDSLENPSKLKIEKDKLEKIIGDLDLTRYHYLRFQLPNSYQRLALIGVRHEYSMGFAEHAGFRSGTARSHYWFDLFANQKTELLIHPFVYMDGTLNEYMNLSIEESKTLIEKLHKEVSDYGGDFVFIWHNETIGNYGKWQGWSEVLDYTLSLKK